MDRFQEQLAFIALRVVGNRGFVLGGGHAVELHGMATRESEDIDLFSTERGSPAEVADDLLAAYVSEGFAVDVGLRTPDLVQMEVVGDRGESYGASQERIDRMRRDFSNWEAELRSAG